MACKSCDSDNEDLQQAQELLSAAIGCFEQAGLTFHDSTSLMLKSVACAHLELVKCKVKLRDLNSVAADFTLVQRKVSPELSEDISQCIVKALKVGLLEEVSDFCKLLMGCIV